MSLYLGSVLKVSDRIVGFIRSRPRLKSWMDWHTEMQWRWMGHYKLGLLRDDTVSDEADIVREALTRITEKEAFDRAFRIRRAMQLQLTNSVLQEEDWVKFEEDVPYLYRHIRDVCKERDEAEVLKKIFSKRRASFM